MPEFFQTTGGNIITLLAGFYALLKGADYLVRGAGSLARRWGVSSLVIGLTIVAFGTSAPEFFVNVASSIKGTNGITIGNIIGSNLANTLLGIGIIAIIRPLIIQKNTAWKEIPFLILATFIFWVSVSDHILDPNSSPLLSRSESVVFLSFFILFMTYIWEIAKLGGEKGEKIDRFSLGRSFFLFVLGLIGLALGGELVVSSSVSMASRFGLSETLIGVTIVALGTSIPDIVTTIVAVLRKNTGLAVGNIIGSNIFNILWVLGVSVFIRPISVSADIQFDMMFLLASVMLFFILQLTHFKEIYQKKSFLEVFSPTVKGKYIIDRSEGIIFVLVYITYIILVIVKQ